MARQPAKQKAKRGPLRGALIVLLMLACLTCAGFLSYYVFQVTQIEVSGSGVFSAEEIVQLSGVQLGQNMFAVTKSQVEQGLAQEPMVVVERVERRWPSTVVIHVSERSVMAAVQYDGQYLLIAEDGMVLDIGAQAQGAFAVTGLGVTGAAKGAVLTGPSAYEMRVLTQVAQRAAASAVADKLTTLDMTDPTMMNLSTSIGVTIRLGNDDNLEQKFVWIDTLLPRLEQEGRRYGTLDVSGTSGASFIP